MPGTPYDIIGIGVGPFNLSLACLTDPIQELDCLFLERNAAFNWHEGTLLEDATLQTPFLCDLVTLADPTSKFSFLNYLKQQDRIYAFYAILLDTADFFLARREFNQYYQWAAEQMDNLLFNHDVKHISYDENSRLYHVSSHDSASGMEKTFTTRHLVLGSGMSPAIPAPCQMAAEHLVHTANYMDNREKLRTRKSITIVGSGQSASEVYYDLFRDIDKYGYSLNWVTRSSRLVPRELTKLTLQTTTPEYTDYFFSLSEAKRNDLVKSLKGIYQGVNPTLINDIFDLRYQKGLVADFDAMLVSNSEITACTYEPTAGEFSLDFHQIEQDKHFTLKSDALILGTGYRFRTPNYLAPITDRINWFDKARFAVARNCSIDKDGREIFVSNAEIHAQSFIPPDLGRACYRNAKIIHEILGRGYYHTEKKIAFQTFAAPPQAGQAERLEHA